MDPPNAPPPPSAPAAGGVTVGPHRRTPLSMTLGFLMIASMLAAGASALPGSSGLGDTDGDGLSDVQEFAVGTDPLSWDTDAGSVSDGWEVYFNKAENRATDEFGVAYVDAGYRFDPNFGADEGAGKFNPSQV